MEQVFQKLYESVDLDQAIDSILEMIGRQFEVSRVYIFEDSEDGASYCNTYEWCNEGIQPQKQMLLHGSYADLGGRGSYQSLFGEQGIFYCTDIGQLPAAVKELLGMQGIKSILQCAIRDAQGWYGFIGFDDCVITRYWTKEQINALAFTSKLLSIFLLKKRAQEQALKKAEDLRMVLDHQNAWIYVVDANTHQLRYINAKTHVIAPNAREGMRCYNAFFGRSSPCKTCPMKIKQPIEIHNPRLNVWVMVDAVPMRWEDEDSYLLTCYDITAYKKNLGEEQKP